MLLPVLLLVLMCVPFRYDRTVSEPDLVHMMAGLVYANEVGAYDPVMYGVKFSFGYYKTLEWLAPSGWLASADLTARLMNLFGLASGLLLAFLCTGYMRAVFGTTVAIGSSVLFLLSPVMLPLAFAGHPLTAATACLFAAGWLMAEHETAVLRAKWFAWALSCGLVLLGLSLRAEILFAFPFVMLARARGFAAPRDWGSVYGPRAIVLIVALAGFLVLQGNYVSQSGGASQSVVSFVRAFISPARIAPGAVIVTLAVGLMTAAVTGLAATRLSWHVARFWYAGILALPSLAFWLANPQPARHFFFPVLGFSLITALWLEARWRSSGRVVAVSVLIVAANQVLAEVTRPLIVDHYAWSYPALTDRRATQRAPIGFFPLDQRANQAEADVHRHEAMLLARQAPQTLLVLTDFPHYMIGNLVAADKQLRWTAAMWHGTLVNELRSPTRTIVIVEKYHVWPHDIVPEVLAESRWRAWPIYVQPSTVSRYDTTPIPDERRYRLRDAPLG